MLSLLAVLGLRFGCTNLTLTQISADTPRLLFLMVSTPLSAPPLVGFCRLLLLLLDLPRGALLRIDANLALWLRCSLSQFRYCLPSSPQHAMLLAQLFAILHFAKIAVLWLVLVVICISYKYF